MRAVLLCCVPAFLFAAGCAGPTVAPANAARYRVVWIAKRAADNTPLVGVTSPVVRVDGSVTVRTDSQKEAENRPAFPVFVARLSRSNRAGLVELVTRASLREVTLGKKGKLKRSKRYIGGLLPIRPGETLGVNGPGDPVVLSVRLEPAG